MGKYCPLTEWLLRQNFKRINLSFSEIEEIIGENLPLSAYKHNQWWMNDKNHSQGKSWIDAGYTVTNCAQIKKDGMVCFEKGYWECNQYKNYCAKHSGDMSRSF